MVALRRSPAPLASATPVARNVVKRTERDRPLVDARRAPRLRVALRAWLCGVEGSTRGYVLELSAGGARLGGMGTKHQPGDRLVAKIVLDEAEAPAVVKVEVVRYAPVAASDRWACPELCVKFLETEGMGLEAERQRLVDLVAKLSPRSKIAP
jgi:hypothetical protein